MRRHDCRDDDGNLQAVAPLPLSARVGEKRLRTAAWVPTRPLAAQTSPAGLGHRIALRQDARDDRLIRRARHPATERLQGSGKGREAASPTSRAPGNRGTISGSVALSAEQVDT